MAATRLEKQQELIEELEEQFELKEVEVSDRSLTFRQFVDKVWPRYEWYLHCEILAQVLQDVADGKRKRVLIFMPPRHGKSQLATRLFPAYFLYRHAQKWVGINSYAAELSYTFSRAARDAYTESGGELRGDASAVKHWETPEGGGCWAAGVGGPITGKGFSLGIIDDPLKNQEEAFSDRIRKKQKEWYGSTFYTRAEQDGAIIVIMTRWHEDDLAGWLISEEKSDEEPEGWHIVNFEAIKEEQPLKIPATCTVEPDWRNPGEALCEERFSLKRLLKVAKRIGTYFWNALYMQRPASLDGEIFKRDWWQYYKEPPGRFDQIILSVDAAFKGTETSDFVVVQAWGRSGGYFYLLDQIRDRMGVTATEQSIKQLHAKWAPKAILIEDKANGPAIIERLSREISGIIAIDPQGGKESRAMAVSPLVEARNVFLPEGQSWVADFVAEFAAFPSGTNDDQVDAMTQALNWLQARPAMKYSSAFTSKSRG